MNEKRTIEKCKKILSMFEELQPRKKQPQPRNKSKHNRNSLYVNECNHSYMSSKSVKKRRADHNLSVESKKSLGGQSVKSNISHLSKKSYTTPYTKQTRFEKIMKLNVKPAYRPKKNPQQSFLNTSQSSLDSFTSEKENKRQNKQSRLEKIMNIKVTKPQVSSTLHHYKPVKRARSISRDSSLQNNSILLMKECKEKIRKMEKQSEKEQRLWHTFERQRQKRLQQKKKQEQKKYQRQRSMQKKFEALVSKQLKKIEKKKDNNERKTRAFSPYLFPSY